MSADRRKHWGWGLESEPPPSPDAVAGLRTHLGFGREDLEDPADVRLPSPRVAIPAALRDVATDAAYDRARYGLGRSYLDVVAGLRGAVAHPPDFVVHARDEADVARTLAWAGEAGVAVVPVGG